MVYAQIKNSKVENLIIIEDSSLLSLFLNGFDYIIRVDNLNPQPGPGWSYDGVNFSAPIPQVDTTIPDVTPRQIRQALILNGVSLAQIDTALNSLSEPTRSLAQVEWEYSISFQRNRPLVANVAAMLGWTPDQLDTLWRFAATL